MRNGVDGDFVSPVQFGNFAGVNVPGRVWRGLTGAEQYAGIQIERGFQSPRIEGAHYAPVVNHAVVETGGDRKAFAAGELRGFDAGWSWHAATIPYSGQFAKNDFVFWPGESILFIVGMRALIFSFLPLFLICGCAVTPQRSLQLPAFATGDENFLPCSKIMGRYANQGEAFTEKGERLGPGFLSQLLFDSNFTGATAEAVNVVESEPDVIDFQFSMKGHSIVTHRLSKYTWRRATGGQGIFANWDGRKYGQPYFCVKGFLAVGISESQGSIFGAGMYAAGTDCLLRKGVDGSLIVLQKVSHFAVIAIVPVGGSQYTWYHFPPMVEGN